MPQIQFHMPAAQHGRAFTLLLWRMTESEEELLSLFPELEALSAEYQAYKSASRRLEYLSVRALLYCYFGCVPAVRHTPEGRPFLDSGMNISVSHTKGYCTVILSLSHNVAVDIEYRSDRVLRIADRFLRADEILPTVEEKLVAWCAKETLYKLHSADRLSFWDMRIRQMEGRQDSETDGKFLIDNLKRGTSAEIEYLTTEDYILTYAVEEII